MELGTYLDLTSFIGEAFQYYRTWQPFTFMAKEQKLQRLMIEVKDYEAQVDRLVDERNDLQCDMRMLKSSKDTINLKLTNAYCLLEESKADIDHKQALIDILRAEISNRDVANIRIRIRIRGTSASI